MRQEEQRRKRFREFKEEKPVSRLISSGQSMTIPVPTRKQCWGHAYIMRTKARCCMMRKWTSRQAGLHARVLRGYGGCALCSLPAGVSQTAAAALLCSPA